MGFKIFCNSLLYNDNIISLYYIISFFIHFIVLNYPLNIHFLPPLLPFHPVFLPVLLFLLFILLLLLLCHCFF